VFHAKVLAVDIGKSHAISALIAGSANLTGAAIGSKARNFEAGLAWKGDVELGVAQQFTAWWEDAWSGGIKATQAIIEKYVKERDKFLIKNPGVLLETSPHLPAELQDATILWVEAGDMSGGSRNQVEFNADLAAFFGPVSADQRLLTITSAKNRWSDRPLSPKQTTFGGNIWRLSLPTVAMGGFVYPGRTIWFKKEETPNGTQYRLDVADIESAKAKAWREDTHRTGVVGRTGGGGGRSYGFK
jgi:hypothetical protein